MEARNQFSVLLSHEWSLVDMDKWAFIFILLLPVSLGAESIETNENWYMDEGFLANSGSVVISFSDNFPNQSYFEFLKTESVESQVAYMVGVFTGYLQGSLEFSTIDGSLEYSDCFDKYQSGGQHAFLTGMAKKILEYSEGDLNSALISTKMALMNCSIPDN